MAITYNALVSAALGAQEEDDTSSEFFAYFPTAVDKAEERLTRDLDTFGFVQYTTVSAESSNPFLAKPFGTRVIKHVSLLQNGRYRDLFMRTDEYLRDYWPEALSVGVPKYYANRGYTQLYLAPTPNANYPVEFGVVVRPSALSSLQQTNWFTDYASNALFYATMVELTLFAKNWEAVQAWETKYTNEVMALRNETRRTRRDDQQSNTGQASENTLLGDNKS